MPSSFRLVWKALEVGEEGAQSSECQARECLLYARPVRCRLRLRVDELLGQGQVFNAPKDSPHRRWTPFVVWILCPSAPLPRISCLTFSDWICVGQSSSKRRASRRKGPNGRQRVGSLFRQISQHIRWNRCKQLTQGSTKAPHIQASCPWVKETVLFNYGQRNSTNRNFSQQHRFLHITHIIKKCSTHG